MSLDSTLGRDSLAKQQEQHEDQPGADGLESEADSDSDVEMDEAAQVAQAKAMAAAVKAKPIESKGEVVRRTFHLLQHAVTKYLPAATKGSVHTSTPGRPQHIH